MKPITFLLSALLLQFSLFVYVLTTAQLEIADIELQMGSDISYRVSAARQEAVFYLDQLRTKIDYLTRLYQKLILNAYENPASNQPVVQLDKVLKNEIPEFFAFTIANSDGIPVIENISGLIGNGCKQSIHDFSTRNHQYVLRLHQINGIDHFDIISRLSKHRQGLDAIFFASFKPDKLIEILGKYDTDEQQFFLSRKSDSRRIELTGKGSRSNLHRSPELTDSEIRHITREQIIPGTDWVIRILSNNTRHDQKIRNILLSNFLPIGLFLSGTLLLTFVGYKHLKNSKRMENTLLYSLADAIITLDKDWNISMVNQHAEELLASSKGNAKSKRLSERFPEFSDYFFKKIRQSFNGKKNSVVEGYFPPSDCWLRISLYWRDSELTLNITDITAEHFNQDRVQWMTMVFNNMNEGMVTIDQNGLIKGFNQAAEKLFGYREEELLGVNVKILMPEDIAEKHDSFIQRCVDNGKSETVQDKLRDLMAKHKDGNLIPIELTISEQYIDNKLVFVGLIHDRREHQEKLDKLEYSSNHDILTGALNRHFLERFLPIAIKKTSRNDELMALLFCDLDKFKEVNDTLGHDEGDRLLQLVTERMKASVRVSDLVIRWGGDEFVIVLNELKNRETSKKIAGKLIEQMALPFKLKHNEVVIGCSIGISLFPGDGEDLFHLQQAADKAMYLAKKQGGCQYWFAG